MKGFVLIGVVVLGTFCLGGCQALIVSRLQTVSAGHTGCNPNENEITNIHSDMSGGGTWNATCKGKTYLCSGAGGKGDSFSCAPVAN